MFLIIPLFSGALRCDIIRRKESGRWNCMEGISAASRSSAAQDVQLAVQYSVMKQVTDLQKDMLSQLMQSMGIGQNIDLLA
jgi:hypothetical protein